MTHTVGPVARIRTDFPDKFGVPRQAGLIADLRGTIVFEPEFRDPDVVRGLDGFSHIWLIWLFSHHLNHGWHTTVRPPRLGGNQRMGVFATRSPFRPNGLGLSAVRLLDVELSPTRGPLLHVGGVDLVDQTPIVDIKPYVASDVHQDASFGFATGAPPDLPVDFAAGLGELLEPDVRVRLEQVLASDPRPAFHVDPTREYGLCFAGHEVKFTIDSERVRVVEVDQCRE